MWCQGRQFSPYITAIFFASPTIPADLRACTSAAGDASVPLSQVASISPGTLYSDYSDHKYHFYMASSQP